MKHRHDIPRQIQMDQMYMPGYPGQSARGRWDQHRGGGFNQRQRAQGRWDQAGAANEWNSPREEETKSTWDNILDSASNWDWDDLFGGSNDGDDRASPTESWPFESDDEGMKSKYCPKFPSYLSPHALRL